MSSLDFGWAARVLPRDATLVEHMSVATVRALAIAVKCKATVAARSAGAVNERLSTHAIALVQDGPERVAAALPDSSAAASISVVFNATATQRSMLRGMALTLPGLQADAEFLQQAMDLLTACHPQYLHVERADQAAAAAAINASMREAIDNPVMAPDVGETQRVTGAAAIQLATLTTTAAQTASYASTPACRWPLAPQTIWAMGPIAVPTSSRA